MPYLMINGLKQEFETFGDIHNPPLILFYGGAINQSTWRVWDYNNSIARLAEENYVICYDRRGHGSSRCPAGTTLEDIAKDIFILMDTLCIEKANVAGLSAGTYLLGCAAGIAPERFNSMILIVPHSHSFNGSPATHIMREAGIDSSKATPEQIRKFSRIGYGPSTTDAVFNALNEYQAQFDRYPALPAEDCANAYKTIENFDNRENFKRIKLPTLVLSGQYDKFCPPEFGRAIAESVDGGRYVEVQDAGHNLFMEKNEECIGYMLDFLRSVR